MSSQEGTLIAVSEFMASDERMQLMSGERFDKFDKVIKMVLSHITLLDNEEPVSDYILSDVSECIEWLMAVYVERPLTPELCQFMQAFSDLMFNWNRNVANDKDLEVKILTVVRFTKGHLTAVEAVSLLKGVVERLRALENWNPPAFELSKHYFQTLKDELNKG